MSTDGVIIIVNNIVIIIGIKRNAKYTKCMMFLVFGHGGWSSCALDGGDDKGFDEHRDDLEGHEDDPHVRLMVVPMVQDLDGKWGFLLSTCLLGLPPPLFIFWYGDDDACPLLFFYWDDDGGGGEFQLEIVICNWLQFLVCAHVLW